MKTYIIYILFILLSINKAHGQNPTINDLNQRISIEARNVTKSELLKEIGEKAEIKFSYNPKVIRATERVSISGEDHTVREILDQLFKDEFTFKLRGNYVIITDEKVVEVNTKVKSSLITGYVVDEETLDGLPNVSIYTSAGENSITDEIGAFKIKLKKEDNSTIELRKKAYQPLSYSTHKAGNEYIQIKLKPIKSLKVTLERDSLIKVNLPQRNQELKTMYKVNESLKLNLENIQDTLYKPVSLSFYPGLSTYGNLSGNIVFNFALNFVGYNGGIEGVELAALSNINRGHVLGVQLAGLSNYTGGEVSGYQGAGIFNMARGNLEGVQMAGISNINLGLVEGAQFAGISNHGGSEVEGLQMAGILNSASKISGGQFSGVLNLARKSSGIQMSGVANLSGKASGVQIAGVANLADTIQGTQISGVLNVAKYAHHQIGLINVADSISGIPIGLLNFIRKGYNRIEVGADELFRVNVSIKTGVRHFYTILTGGMQTDVFDNESSFYTFGLGIGTSRRLTKGLNLDLNVVNRHISKKSFTDQLSYNLKGSIGLELKVVDNLSIYGGGVYNAYYFDRELLEDSDFNELRSSYLMDTSNELDRNHVWRTWIGYQFGVRLII
ncbi:MAG: hypothetical protein AAGA77_14215 [Bacteroidota bacterium]